MLAHRAGPGVVGRKREPDIAELRQHPGEIARRAVEVFSPVMRIDAEAPGGPGHQLTKPDRPLVGDHRGIVGALNLDIGAIEVQPVGDGNTGRAQARVARVAQRGLFESRTDVRARCRCMGYCRSNPERSGGPWFLAEYADPGGRFLLADAVIVGAREAFLGS